MKHTENHNCPYDQRAQATADVEVQVRQQMCVTQNHARPRNRTVEDIRTQQAGKSLLAPNNAATSGFSALPGQKNRWQMQALDLTCWNRAAPSLAVQGDEDISPSL